MSKPRILIVEDEVIVARDISQQLVELGYEPVGSCTRGEEAVATAEKLRPDLVLMDIQLTGGMDGIAAAKLIREQLALPVVFLTAFAEGETVNRAKLAEPFGYIIKPFDERELRTVVEMALYKYQTETKLRDSEERYRLLFEHNPLPMWLCDDETLRFVAVNETAIRSYGYSLEEFLGMTVAQIRPQEDVQHYREKWQQKRAEPFHNLEMRHCRKDGSIMQVEIISRSLVYQGRPSRLVLAADITEKKQLQEQFLRAQRLEGLGMLASGIAHDLNNMLAPILFAAPLLRPNASTARDLRILDTVEKSAERGSSLVRQILTFAQGSTGAPRITQLKHITRDVLAIVEVSFPKNIRLEQHISSSAWPVPANPTQIHQVVLNLCVNARDAMPHGGTLTVRLGNRPLDAESAAAIPGARAGDWVVLEVSDTGTGIPPDVLPHIWDSFFTTKAPGSGTGLGLPTVRSIVSEHTGFIQVETAVGRGTTFRIFLPASRDGEGSGSGSASPFAEALGREELILVVDDDESVREIITAILRQGGYRVLACADGVEAIVQYNTKSQEIALVITDVDMPNLGGAILAGTLLKLNPRLRIIAMSGLTSVAANSTDLTEIKVLATAYLQKPFLAADLLATVQRVLQPEPQP
jgi:PAS domain S-box-containing protein